MAEVKKEKKKRGAPENMVPFGVERPAYTHEEAVENGRKGGIASGIVRKKKADMKEAIDLLLSMKARGTTKQVLEGLGYDEEEQTNANAIAATLFSMGMDGDHKALDTLLTYVLAVKEDDRKTKESEARIAAMGVGTASAVTSSDDDDGDVIIYLPQIESEEAETPAEEVLSEE